jgi:hypothetical protein
MEARWRWRVAKHRRRETQNSYITEHPLTHTSILAFELKS